MLERIVEHSSSREDRNDDHDRRDDHRDHRHDDHHRHDDEHGEGREPRDRKRNRLSDIAGLFGGGGED